VADIVKSINERHLNRPIEVLFVDESHFTNEPYVHRGWFRKGQQTRVPQPVKRHHGAQQQPWSSQSPVQHTDQPGTRKMVIPVMANRIICAKLASVSLALMPQTASFLPSAVRRLKTYCASASPCAGFAAW
jgi:hypothetical protein